MIIRIEESLDSRLKFFKFDDRLKEFEEKLRENKVLVEEDPEDFSILPRIISKAEDQRIQEMCRVILESAFSALQKYLRNPSVAPTLFHSEYLLSQPFHQNVLSGNARFDFLKQNDLYKLIEMNFVNVGAIIESTESAALWLQVFPEFRRMFSYKSPAIHARSRLQEQDVRNVLLLTRDDYSAQFSDFSERTYLKRMLHPLETTILPEREYSRVMFDEKVRLDDITIDAIYPKHLDGTNGKEDALFKREAFCRSLLSSDVFVFDHFVTMLLENKDLRFLGNGAVTPYLPKIFDPSELEHVRDYSGLVLKEKDIHMGKGITIAPTSINVPNTIVQERICANSFPVLALDGNSGKGVFDTGVYVSYRYDINRGSLDICEVAGYLTRFSLTSEIVNISRGGGVIPTLVER